MSEYNYNKIVSDFAGRIYNHAYRILGSREIAEEATQDAFLKIYKGLKNFRGDAQLSTWIWRITVNVCLTYRAKKSNQFSATLNHIDAEIAGDNNAAHPETSTILNENREEIYRCIQRLNPKESAAITLFYLEEMDYKEIASALEIPMGSVATLLHRGREKLKELLIRNESINL